MDSAPTRRTAQTDMTNMTDLNFLATATLKSSGGTFLS